MKENRKPVPWKPAALAALALLLLAVGYNYADRRLTYIESAQLNEQAELSIAVADSHTVLEQEFLMPYERLYRVEVKAGTFGRNNRSFWEATLREKNSGKKVFDWEFNASQVTDGAYYSLETGFPVRVKEGKTYVLSISSKDAAGNSALAFYTSSEDVYAKGSLFVNGERQDADLTFQVCGGERDGFWIGLYAFYSLMLVALGIYAYSKCRKGEKLWEDRLFQGAALMAALLLLTYFWSRTNLGSFTDESDNIRGGMLIARGKALYRDYYTQHTPFVYYLCSLFALLGAGSVQQFRLLYYIVLAAVWAGLYYRHSGHFGRARMFLLPILQTVLVTPMYFQGSKLIGDNIQGVCMTALVLEFLRYRKDRELTASRCAIVAACIYASVMSTFVSAFALTPVLVGVLAMEISFWGKDRPFRFKAAVKRYWKPVAFTAAPFGLTVLYFACVHALREFYLMAYRFNTLVYKNYQDEFGRVKWKPFVLGIRNFFAVISDKIEEILTAVPGGAQAMETNILPLLLVGAAGIALVLWALRKDQGRSVQPERILTALCLFLCITGNMTRNGADFHAVPAYNVIVTLLVVLSAEGSPVRNRKAMMAVGVFVACYCIQPFVTLFADSVVYKQPVVDGLDKEVVELTEPGEGIFIDTYIHDSIYLLYRDRYPVNRNCYILPWYMDWFEQDTVEDLKTFLPRIAIYDPGAVTEGEESSCPALTQTVERHYERQSEESFLWRLKQ